MYILSVIVRIPCQLGAGNSCEINFFDAAACSSDSICWPQFVCVRSATPDEQTTGALLVMVAIGTYLKFRVDLRAAEYTEIVAKCLALAQPRH